MVVWRIHFSFAPERRHCTGQRRHAGVLPRCRRAARSDPAVTATSLPTLAVTPSERRAPRRAGLLSPVNATATYSGPTASGRAATVRSTHRRQPAVRERGRSGVR